MNKKKADIFGKFVLYTNISIWSLVFLVPIGAYFLTGEKAYLSPVHFALAGVVGLMQILVTRIYKKSFQRYWNNVSHSLAVLSQKLKEIKSVKDIKEFRKEKNKLLKPILEEKSFSQLGESLNELLEELANLFETKLFKEELIRRLTSTLSTEKLSKIFTSNVIRYFNVDGTALYLKTLKGDVYELKINKGFGPIKETLDEGFLEKVKSAEEQLIIDETLNFELDLGVCDVKAKSVLIHPLYPRKGKLLGVIFLGFNKEISPTDKKKLENFFSEIEPTLSLIFENAYEHERSITFANYDSLTGALNRRAGLRLLRNLLQKAHLNGTNLCIFVIDIDHFKKINDTYGHEIGDLILKKVVELIRNSVRDEDLIIRWGGEEFLIVLDNIPSEKAAEIAERIRKNIAETELELPNGVKLKVTASIGVACTLKDDTFLFEELFRLADERLYRAKKSGRNRVIAD